MNTKNVSNEEKGNGDLADVKSCFFPLIQNMPAVFLHNKGYINIFKKRKTKKTKN